MIARKSFFIFLLGFQHLFTTPLLEQFKNTGFIEILDENHRAETFDSLYQCFDELIEFLQTNPAWKQKLYCAKERFIRSKHKHLYSTDLFGFYDESEKEGRAQIAFYYSTHFHEFITAHFSELKKATQINNFFEACLEIQKPYGSIFYETARSLGLETILNYENPPLLLKVIKYLPSYKATRPHYDGSVFSLFLDSTDKKSLLLSPYQSSFTIDDFALRVHSQNSILLIPGAFLAEFSIDPTPHIVATSGKTRYATVAFAMRPYYSPQQFALSALPCFIVD